MKVAIGVDAGEKWGDENMEGIGIFDDISSLECPG